MTGFDDAIVDDIPYAKVLNRERRQRPERLHLNGPSVTESDCHRRLALVRVQRARGWYRDYESTSSSNRAPVAVAKRRMYFGSFR